ncbi:MAG: protein kinase [Candidatus Zixiibacteriota bacterium]|nr:MAG: protein kinase [candidate division Zixibacteria bacterium]
MLETGQEFAHFQIIRKLGEGGMGTVYLAEDKKLSRQVALKTLSAEVFSDAERLDRFYREARTAARVSHPNVMAIHDIGSTTNSKTGLEQSYIVMEYVKGRPLSKYLGDEKPGMSRLLRLAEKTAAGLAAAHQMKIVHRDIKPDNILVDHDGNPKILDFGLAKPVDPVQMDDHADGPDTISEELTRAGKILGTVKYMSPEQVQGKPVDSRSDIFSFGILMYSMFTGSAPFAGQSQVSTMAKILEVRHDSPRALNVDMPPELERIIDKCLQKDPADRYQDTRDLVVDLRNLRRQSDSGVTGAISVVTDRFSGEHRAVRKRIIWPIVAVAVFMVAAALYVFGDLRSFMGSSQVAETGANANTLAIIGFENKTEDPGLDWLETGLPEILLTDLSQSREIQLIPQQRIMDCFDVGKRANHTFAECSEAAQRLGAGRLLSGAFYKLGDKLRIDARLEEIATGKIIIGEKVVGDDPFVLVDSLTTKIAAALDLGMPRRMTTVALSTPEAFKQYHLGMEDFWAYDFEAAIEQFNQAIAIDSSFALPYMRIGIANQFMGRQAESERYFRLAKAREDRLPIRERSLLDMYADTWLNEQFDHAFTKLKALVRDYPDDPEIRTIYALFVNAFQRDTTIALAHLDTALAAYPNYPFAINAYAGIERGADNLDRAAEMIERLNRVLPDALDPKTSLVQIYQLQERWEEALTVAKELREKFEDSPRPLRRLIPIALHLRDFDAARAYTEEFRAVSQDDAFTARDYEGYLAAIDLWEGKFHSSMSHRFGQLASAHETGDSSLVFAQLNVISDYYRRFEMPDSAMVYETEGFEYAQTFDRISYPIRLVQMDPANESVARPIFESVMEDFRERYPKDIWDLVRGQEEMFEALITQDTARMISALRMSAASVDQEWGDFVFLLGELLVRTGEYQEGMDVLNRGRMGQFRTSNGWSYLISTYFVGVANEGLGNTGDAIDHYREFLRFWDEADIQLEQIRDARARLARLTS